jgi:uncharacterized cupin superfamily protein
VEIARLLHTFGGPLLALFGGIGARSMGTLVTGMGSGVRTVDFAGSPRPCKPYRPDPGRIVSGDPAQTVSVAYQSDDGLFSAGTWTCQPGKWHIEFAQNEFVHILEGVVVVTDGDGLAKTYRLVLSKADTQYVACSDPKERERVRENFLKKKLGLNGDDLDASIEATCVAMKADRTKSRLTFYYLLAEHHGKLDQFA